jgi:hypothetical protein
MLALHCAHRCRLWPRGTNVAPTAGVSISKEHASAGRSVAFPGAMLNPYTPYVVFEREHRVLREAVEKLRRALAENQPGSENDLIEHGEAVRAQLAAHFAFEEDFGFMHHLGVIPGLAPTLDRLRAVHSRWPAVRLVLRRRSSDCALDARGLGQSRTRRASTAPGCLTPLRSAPAGVNADVASPADNQLGACSMVRTDMLGEWSQQPARERPNGERPGGPMIRGPASLVVNGPSNLR